MSQPLVKKRVNEKFAIGFEYISPDLEAGETISSASVTVPSGLTAVGSEVISGAEVSQIISGGTVDTDYVVTFLVTTSAGHIFEDKIIVRIIY